MGHFPAIVATFCGYIMVAIFGTSAELMIADEILARLLPLDLPPVTLIFSIVVFLTTLNLLGVELFDKFQFLVVFMMVVALLIIGGGCVFAAVWVKFVMKRRLFEAESVDRAMGL